MTQKTCLILFATLFTSFAQRHTIAAVVDIPVSLAPIANQAFSSFTPSAPTGVTTLGGVTFDIPVSQPYWAAPNVDTSATLLTNIDSALSARLLILTGLTFSSQMNIGDRIGTLTFAFASGSPTVVPVLVGVNVREWGIGASGVINTFADPNMQEVWRGVDNTGRTAVIDMLSVSFDGSRTLTGVTISDESQARIGNNNPILAVRGVTVQSVPEPTTGLLLVVGLLLTVTRCRLNSKATNA